jgi:hypothetical protein
MQLKGKALGLDHYEGRSYLGWYHHTVLGTVAHGFSPWSDRVRIARGRPDRLSKVVLLQPIFEHWTGRCHTCQRPIDLGQLLHHKTSKS